MEPLVGILVTPVFDQRDVGERLSRGGAHGGGAPCGAGRVSTSFPFADTRR